MELARRPVGLFENYIRLGEARFDVSPLIGFGYGEVSILVNCWRLRIQCFLHVDHEGEDFVLDLDRACRIPRLVRCLRRDRGHLLASVAAVVIEKTAGRPPIAEVPRQGDARCGGCDHGTDARHGLRPTGIHACDSRMRVWAANDGRVEHVRESQVERVERGAAHPLVPIHSAQALSHDSRLAPRLQLLGRGWRFRRLYVDGGQVVFHQHLLVFR